MREATMKAKKEQVNQIKDKLSESSSSVIVEYRGLSVQKVTELRSLLREENVEFKVYKNTMVSRAADAAGLNDLNEYLTGPNAIAFSDDAVAPSRILAKFAKKNRKLILKGGVVEGKIVNADTLKSLANLPNRDGMLSMLLSVLQAPVRSVALAIKAVAEQKGEGQPADEAPVVEEATVEEVKEEAVEA
ncbi:MAG: 50S ribosomal protein L10 [Bacillota bacterium]|nr:50S ribosomal protein L10 [Bacillota bacterium]